MRLNERFKILLQLVGLSMLLTMPLLAGCLGGREHVIQLPGSTGVSLGNNRYVFGDAEGKPVIGEIKTLPAGAMVRLPKTEAEVIETLKAAGLKPEEAKKLP